MVPDPSLYLEALGIPDILNALGINCGAVTQELDRYIVVPGNSGPRWLVPASAHGAASVLSSWRPYSLMGQVKWIALRMAIRTGVVRIFPSVSSLTIPHASSLRWFERCGIAAQAGQMVIMVGNPSPDRKLTVFLLDAAGQIAAVLKVGLTHGGRLSAVHEAEVLRKLELFCWAPDLLTILPDLGAAAQQYVHGSQPDSNFRQEYLNLLCNMPLGGTPLNLAAAAHAIDGRLHPFADELQEAAPDLLHRCLSCLALDKDIPTILVHGDFVPWNIRKTSDCGYVLVDWEWADFTGLPMHDLLHFHFSVNRFLGKMSGGYPAIRELSVCNEYLTQMDLDKGLLPQFAILYLLDQLASQSEHRDAEGGSYTLNQLKAVIGSCRG